MLDAAGVPDVAGATWVLRSAGHRRDSRRTHICVVGWALAPGPESPVLLPSAQVDPGPRLLDGIDPRMLEPRGTARGSMRSVDYVAPAIDRPRAFDQDLAILSGDRSTRDEPCLRRASGGRDFTQSLLGFWAHRRGRPDLSRAAAVLGTRELMGLRRSLGQALLLQAQEDHLGFASPDHVAAALERLVAIGLDAADSRLVRAKAWLTAMPRPIPAGADASYLGFLVHHLHDQATGIQGEYGLFMRPEHHRPPQWWAQQRIRNLAKELASAGLAAVPPLLARLDDPTVTRISGGKWPTGFVPVSELVRQVIGIIARRELADAAAVRAWWTERCAVDAFAAALQRAHDAPPEQAHEARLAALRVAITPVPLRGFVE